MLPIGFYVVSNIGFSVVHYIGFYVDQFTGYFTMSLQRLRIQLLAHPRYTP